MENWRYNALMQQLAAVVATLAEVIERLQRIEDGLARK